MSASSVANGCERHIPDDFPDRVSNNRGFALANLHWLEAGFPGSRRQTASALSARAFVALADIRDWSSTADLEIAAVP